MLKPGHFRHFHNPTKKHIPSKSPSKFERLYDQRPPDLRNLLRQIRVPKNTELPFAPQQKRMQPKAKEHRARLQQNQQLLRRNEQYCDESESKYFEDGPDFGRRGE